MEEHMKENIQMLKNTEIKESSANGTINREYVPFNEGCTRSVTFVDIKQPEKSEWVCYMYGSKPSDPYKTIYHPYKESTPNKFVRFMMKICLGCTWVKN